MSHTGFALFSGLPRYHVCTWRLWIQQQLQCKVTKTCHLTIWILYNLWLNFSCSSLVSMCHWSDVSLFLSALSCERDVGLPRAPPGILPARIIQTDVNFPQCPPPLPPPSVLCPPLTSSNLNHGSDSREYHLLCSSPLWDGQTSASGPLPAHPPIPPFYPLCIWSLPLAARI